MTGFVDVSEVTVRYGDAVAVDHLSMSFEAGQVHGLLGRMGAGKTSLLSVIAGFRRASSGTVTVDGHEVFENPRAVRQVCLIRGGGDTVQHDWPGDRVHHALDLAALLRPNWDTGFADRLVERLQLPRTARVPELSRGQRSALGVVLGLASRAPVTLLDETHLGMDAPSRYAFYDELLADQIDHPRTVIISTHLIEEVAPLFQTVTMIDRGQLLLQADADELRSHGVTVTGPADAVAAFTSDREVLASRTLGPTRSDTVYGDLDDDARRDARQAGLELGPVPLQDLFVHLTDPDRVATARRTNAPHGARS